MVKITGLLELQDAISQATGFPSHVLRFISSLVLAYPLGILYRAVFKSLNQNIQHIYFTACGLGIMSFCFGWNCLHSLLNITMIYCLMCICGPTLTTVVLSFIINMAYLHVAYAVRLYDGFMLDWSVPHCILCLRLTGIAWDYYDGCNYNNNEISEDTKSTRISKVPTCLELTGYCYFYGGVLTGPQFPIRKYLAMVDGTLEDKDVNSLDGVWYGFQRLALGIVYIILFALLYPTIHAKYFVSEWYENISIFHQIWCIFWFQEFLWMKYLGLFLVSEGGCIVSGLGYNGKTEDGKPKWDGVANMKIVSYETAYTVQQVIQSFHLQTSLWLVRYVYKRLKFLGNRVLSLFLSQTFLAIWHGVSPGYYFLFFFQFVYVMFEKTVTNAWEGFGWKRITEFPLWLKCLVIPLLYLQKQFMLGYGSLPLALLHLNLIHKVRKSIPYKYYQCTTNISLSSITNRPVLTTNLPYTTIKPQLSI